VNLDDIRRQIDTIDQELLGLLNRRADLVHEVGVVKKRDGLQIYAPEREEALLRRLISMNEGRLSETSIRAIYREIMSAALALEDDLKIAYLGPEGTWTHQAAVKKFGHSVSYSPQPNFSDVFDQVTRRKADYGVVPIENSTEGAVSHTLDLFVDSPLHICSQILLRIENCLPSRAAKSVRFTRTRRSSGNAVRGSTKISPTPIWLRCLPPPRPRKSPKNRPNKVPPHWVGRSLPRFTDSTCSKPTSRTAPPTRPASS
jgi:chorismate mutase-like protein